MTTGDHDGQEFERQLKFKSSHQSPVGVVWLACTYLLASYRHLGLTARETLASALGPTITMDKVK